MTQPTDDPDWRPALQHLQDFAMLCGFVVTTISDRSVDVRDDAGHSLTVTWYDQGAARVLTSAFVSIVVSTPTEPDRPSGLLAFVEAVTGGNGREGVAMSTDKSSWIGTLWELEGDAGSWASGYAEGVDSQIVWRKLPQWVRTATSFG